MTVRLGIDLDGVVANFTKGWVERYNREFGTSLAEADVRTWGAMIDLTDFDDMEEFWAWAANGDGPSIFRHLEPYPNAIGSLQRLHRGHEIVIITTKPDFAWEDTRLWLRDHDVPYDELHITEEKWKVPCDVYLEDSPHQLDELTLERPDRVVCRFVRPWNAPVTGARDIHDWDEFVALVDRIWC